MGTKQGDQANKPRMDTEKNPGPNGKAELEWVDQIQKIENDHCNNLAGTKRSWPDINTEGLQREMSSR